jgi:group I intron endonuclease
MQPRSPVPSVIGIYIIENLADRKCYVGSSINVRKRVVVHKRELLANRHTNEHLQRAFNRHGEQNFTFTLIETCDRAALIEREQFHIDTRQASLREFGYNLCPSATFLTVSDETRAKLRAATLGVKRGPMSQEHRAKLSAAKKGKPLEPHVAAMLAKISRERVRTPEERAKLSAAKMGHAVSDESRRKMSQAKRRLHPARTPTAPKARRCTPETRAKISATLMGHAVSQSTRSKLRAALSGRAR